VGYVLLARDYYCDSRNLEYAMTDGNKEWQEFTERIRGTDVSGFRGVDNPIDPPPIERGILVDPVTPAQRRATETEWQWTVWDKIRVVLWIKSLYSQFKEKGMTNDLKATLIGFVGGALAWLGSYIQSGVAMDWHGILGGLGVFALGWITNKGQK
jgi:hypothetical protein